MTSLGAVDDFDRYRAPRQATNLAGDEPGDRRRLRRATNPAAGGRPGGNDDSGPDGRARREGWPRQEGTGQRLHRG